MKGLLLFLVLLYCKRVQGREFGLDEKFKRAHIGYCIAEIASEKEISSSHAEEYFIPASLQKIPLSVASIALLQENYRFSTTLEYEGRIDQEGILHGNLCVYGGGDPTLSLDIFTQWEQAAKQKGIEKIEGKIIVDSSCFETALASPSWFFEDLGNYFGAGACGLSINRNLYEITFQPGAKEGDPAKILKTVPSLPHLIVHNEVKTGPKGSGDQVYVFGMEYSPVQFYRGSVPLDQPTLTVKAAIPDPPRFCAEALQRKIAASKGVEIEKGNSRNRTKMNLLYKKESPPLKDLLHEMNQHSINLYAEHLLKAVGKGTLQEGCKIVQQFLKRLDIPCVMRDGSGLSRTNFITPRGFAKLLIEIKRNPTYRSIYDSFPQSGQGTLKSFPLLQGATLRAKTGSMHHIRNLGGYLILPSGKEYAFCLFCNNYEGNAKEIEEEMLHFLNQVIRNISINP